MGILGLVASVLEQHDSRCLDNDVDRAAVAKAVAEAISFRLFPVPKLRGPRLFVAIDKAGKPWGGAPFDASSGKLAEIEVGRLLAIDGLPRDHVKVSPWHKVFRTFDEMRRAYKK